MLPTMYSGSNGWIPAIFNDFFSDALTPKFRGTTPAINVSEDESGFTVEVAAPGMTKNDFNIHLTSDGDIVISMEKKNETRTENKKKTYLRREFGYSKFEQRLTLPDNVERQKITASMDSGVLNILIPKMTEQEKAQATQFIEIK
ncbi:MAG: Hsp20/alpha crystallin family protein [Bacteroidaceae bacterium]|nr:Hsp20/alpha crystallin family protein [Bacteroidaceae bacterium]